MSLSTYWVGYICVWREYGRGQQQNIGRLMQGRWRRADALLTQNKTPSSPYFVCFFNIIYISFFTWRESSVWNETTQINHCQCAGFGLFLFNNSCQFCWMSLSNKISWNYWRNHWSLKKIKTVIMSHESFR